MVQPHKAIHSSSSKDINSYGDSAVLFVCAEVLRPSQPNAVMSIVVSLPNHTFTARA